MSNLITKIWVEPIGASFQVVMRNNRNQRLIMGEPKPLQLALTDAHELGDFFKLTPTPFKDSRQRVVQPDVLRDTYNDGRIRTQAEIVAEYRLPTGELNWNKLMRYEWSHFRNQATGGFTDKLQLRAWLLPFQATGPTDTDAAEAAREWLRVSTNGAWLPSKGNVYLFSDDRDSTLFKMFHQ